MTLPTSCSFVFWTITQRSARPRVVSVTEPFTSVRPASARETSAYVGETPPLVQSMRMTSAHYCRRIGKVVMRPIHACALDDGGAVAGRGSRARALGSRVRSRLDVGGASKSERDEGATVELRRCTREVVACVVGGGDA
ncbi:hypothetical protein C8R46DRAFT_1223760 [Mycena filopes]|nr:hypothetical protein C8R46DRAFT_1223760 [Mycena filopes]